MGYEPQQFADELTLGLRHRRAMQGRLRPRFASGRLFAGARVLAPGPGFRAIPNGLVEERRISSYFIPIAQPRKKGNKQLQFDTEWTQDRIEENRVVNRIRQRVGLWRDGGYLGVTPTTSKLFEYWTKPERERKLFFCQIEALETAIYIAEVAKKYGDPWIENQLREANDQSNPGLPRMALKMATGSGKTVVMAIVLRKYLPDSCGDRY